jgi:hypothetical protein
MNINNNGLNYYLENPGMFGSWIVIPTHKYDGHVEISKHSKKVYVNKHPIKDW